VGWLELLALLRPAESHRAHSGHRRVLRGSANVPQQSRSPVLGAQCSAPCWASLLPALEITNECKSRQPRLSGQHKRSSSFCRTSVNHPLGSRLVSRAIPQEHQSQAVVAAANQICLDSWVCSGRAAPVLEHTFRWTLLSVPIKMVTKVG